MALEVVLVDVEITGVAGVKSVIVVDLIFKSFNPRNVNDTIYVGIDLVLFVQVLRSALDEWVQSLDSCRVWLQAPIVVLRADERTDYRVHQEDVTDVW